MRCPPARARFPYGLSVADERRPGDDRGVSRVVTGRRPGRPREDQRTLAHPLVEMLRTARQEAGWTQARLARHLGVVEQTVSAWECGRSPLYLHHAQRWADALELDVEWRLEERFRVKPTRI